MILSTPFAGLQRPNQLSRALYWSVLGLLAVLPLAEGPKNILWCAVFLFWLLSIWTGEPFPALPTSTIWIFGSYLAITIYAALLAPMGINPWKGVWDTVRVLSMFFLIPQITKQSERETIYWVIIAATIVGLACGFILSVDPRANLQLKSVGHTNHSAIFLTLVLGVALAMIFGGSSLKRRLIACVVFGMLFEGILRTSSRGAVVIALILPSLMGIALGGFFSRRFFYGVAASIVLSVHVFTTNQPVVKETVALHQNHSTLSQRDKVWRVALEIFREHPLAGVGPNNFATVTKVHLQQWLAKRGEVYHPENYYFLSHAHNLFLNTLAERGILGGVSVIALLVCLFSSLVRIRPKKEAQGAAIVAWGAAVAAWAITVMAGTINTTLHHEHGMLTMALLGLALKPITSSTASPTPPCNRV